MLLNVEMKIVKLINIEIFEAHHTQFVADHERLIRYKHIFFIYDALRAIVSWWCVWQDNTDDLIDEKMSQLNGSRFDKFLRVSFLNNFFRCANDE